MINMIKIIIIFKIKKEELVVYSNQDKQLEKENNIKKEESLLEKILNDQFFK